MGPGSLPNYTFRNQGCSDCSTGFNRKKKIGVYLRKSGLQWLLNRFQPKKKLGYTFGNQGCSGCSTGFNHSWISPKLYLRKPGLQWLLNRFQPKKKIGVYLLKSRLQWSLNRFQPKKKNWGIPSEIMVAVVAQLVSTILGSLPNYTFGNQGCSGCSTGFNRKKKIGVYLRKSWLQWLLNRFQPKKKIGVYLRKSWLQWLLNRFQPFLDISQTIPSEIRVAVVAQLVSTKKKIWVYLRKSGLQWLLNRFQPKKNLGYTFKNQGCSGCSTGFNRKKKFGYTFENQGCSGCSTSFNHSWISPKLYLRKSGLQWLLNRFQP